MQKLHLVMGGRVKDPQTLDFVDLKAIDLVGVYADYAAAEEAWRSAAQRPSPSATSTKWRRHRRAGGSSPSTSS